jgi:FkbM family methyltransferase
MNSLKNAIQRLVRLTPYEIRKKLPNVTLDAVKLLLAYYHASGREVIIVQIGACDGSVCDPVHEFLRHGKMRALLLEPMPRSFAKLQKTYASTPNVSILQAAVSRTDGTVTMYGVKANSTWRPPDESMLYASLLKSHLLTNGVPEADIEETTVPSFSLQSLFAKYGLATVDLLQVDTEGYDAEIVKMALELPIPPRCINFEKKSLSTAQMRGVYGPLEQKGYLFIHDEMNTLAVHQSVEKSFSE